MYAATVQGRALTFDVRGVWRRNMVMRDRETGSLGQHATGEAVYGPLRGRQLTVLGGTLATWAAWREQVPHTDLGVEPEPPVQSPLITHARANRMLRIVTRGYTPGTRALDTRLDAHAVVGGVQRHGAPRAYPLEALRGAGVVNETLGDDPLALWYDATRDTLVAFLRQDARELVLEGDHLTIAGSPDPSEPGAAGASAPRWDPAGRPVAPGADQSPLQPLHVQRQWWLGWCEFHPTTTVYGVD